MADKKETTNWSAGRVQHPEFQRMRFQFGRKACSR